MRWVADGIEGTESETLQDMLYIAVDSRSVVASILALPWVQDGIVKPEVEAIAWLKNFSAEGTASSVAALVALDWVQDGIEELEVKVIQELSYVDQDNSAVAASLIALPLVQDGVEDAEFEAIDWINNFGSGDAMTSIVALGWVQDGIEELEVKTIQELSYIDYYDSMVAATVIAFPWVQDGVSEVEFKAIDRINHFGAGKVMASVVELGWVQDDIDELEAKAIEDLSDINYYDSTVAASVVALSWVQDGILELEGDTLPVLDYMNYINAPLATYVVALPWMQDGIEAIERETLNWLNNEQWGQTVHHVTELSWVQDNIDEVERDAISNLYYLTTHDSSITETVVAFDWVQDGVDKLEDSAINDLRWIAKGDAVLAQTVVAFDWVQDGLDTIEGDAIDNLHWISADDVVLAQSVVDLHWVQDGVTTLENSALNQLAWFTEDTSPASKALVALPWVQDGVTAIEVDTFDWLNAFSEPGTALQIVSMPFLETLEPADSKAVEALGQMVLWEEDQFQRVMAHPTFSAGITDDWATIVATLYGVSKYDAESIDALLDPGQVTIEERTIGLPLAGETQLAIIRTAPGAGRSMDLLEHAVHYAEEYMATYFPTGYVGYLFGASVPPSFGGANFGTHIASLVKYDVDDDSREADFAGNHVAHEVAHYYWGGNSSWVDEGLANFMASVSENNRIGQPIEVTEYPCGYVRTIAELEALDITNEAGADSAFICNYALGERLFMDLYRSLGEDSLRQGLRNLYTLSQTVQENDEEVGIEHVRSALKDVDGVDDQIVDVITARWYEGTEPYDTSGRDIDPVNRRFVTVNGGIDVAYLAATSGGPPATSFSAKSADDWVRLFLDYSYSVGNNTEVPLEIVTYFEDGFVFSRQNENFTAKPGYIGATWWLSVGASPSNPWAPGKYYVYVYNEGRKLVELEYEVTD